MTAQPQDRQMIDAALSYAARGWFVFPLRGGSKGRDKGGRSGHYLENGHNGASDDPDLVRDWWTRWPEANIGLHLAASGLVAIDIDAYKADCGWEAFAHDHRIPETMVQRSARGGLHHIFNADVNQSFAGKLCSGVDIKHHGYILLEPSTFEGQQYQFVDRRDPAPAPDWLTQQKVANGGDSKGGRMAGSKPSQTCKIALDAPASEAEVAELLDWIDPDACGYAGWIEILQALHDHFGGGVAGLAMAESWSARGAKFRQGEVASKWQGFNVGTGVTVRSIAKRARANGADLASIARRHRSHDCQTSQEIRNLDDRPDLSHDHLALDIGRRSWDQDARHVALWNQWLFWSGSHWRRDDTLESMSRTRTYLRTRASELIEWAERRTEMIKAHGKPEDARKLLIWSRDQARILRSNATVAAVSGLARANSTSATTHTSFDADLFTLGTPGGTVDLRTGEVRRACREDMISRMTSVAPSEPGTHPERWERFLDETFDGNRQVIAFMQRAAGYALTGSTVEHKLLFLFGSGRNGKSVFLNTLLDIWGTYGRRVAATTFLSSQTERHPTDIAGLQGARLAIASELQRGKVWDEAVIKDLTGGDRMTARFMRQDYFDFDPQMTLMIAGNTQPSFRGVDEAIRSRVVLVPFNVTVPADRRDPKLSEKLKQEAPAILRWCIDGALDWQHQGLNVPSSIADASAAYFDEEDTVGQFLRDETIAEPGVFVGAEQLILQFNIWSERQGLSPWAQRTLIKELRQRGFENGKSNGRRGLRGLRLA
ncbi:MAG: hypothetical protein COB97_09955 [Paracoccus sp.]|nr:MAG: hypothetical protein COB97_09955 [Paracoccus sp. (in: a-proteobacteria)]